jgi:hypothetical protein
VRDRKSLCLSVRETERERENISKIARAEPNHVKNWCLHDFLQDSINELEAVETNNTTFSFYGRKGREGRGSAVFR